VSGPDSRSGPEILLNRYVLINEPARSGGMSTVHKAFDPRESRLCAVKRMKILHDNDRRRKESFQREHAALIDLSEHPHIVALYDAGMDDAGPFMVLEWVPDNLVSLIAKTGPLPWERFYLEIGRPILGALAFAQSRGWNHRDIKPQNILVTEQTTVKIADYGIARQFERPAIGLTLREYRSEPFTPPESDAGPWSCSQDCFSWAAVAVFCLTATYPTSYERLFGLATGLDSVTVPREILLNSLASIPAERPPLASALLSDLDEYLERQNAQRQPRPRVHVQFSSSSIPQLLSTFDSTDQATAEEMVLQELNEIEVGFRRVDMGDSVPSLRIWAVSWVFEVSRSVQRDRLIITRARPSRASEAERHREEAYRVPVRFTFTAPHSTGSSDVLDELFLNVDAFEIARARRDAQIKRERIFRVWYAFLRAKADYEARRERAVAYTDHEVHDNSIVLTTELPAPVEMVGEARVIRMTSGGHVFCDVVDVNLDEVTVVVTSGDSSKVPRRGLLELNTLAAERAIERQRRALDAVNYERSPNPRLKNLILEPADKIS